MFQSYILFPCSELKSFQHGIWKGKELRVEYTQSNTTILTFIINIMRVLTTTCFGLTRGPSSGCKIRLDKLYYNAWETFWEKGAGVLGVPWFRFI